MFGYCTKVLEKYKVYTSWYIHQLHNLTCVVDISVGGQTVTTSLEVGISLTSTSDSPNVGSITKTLIQSISTSDSTVQSSHSLRETVPPASVTLSLTPSPAQSLSTILHSVGSTDIRPSSVVQILATSTNSTRNLSNDVKSQVNTYANTATITATLSYRDSFMYPSNSNLNSVLSSYIDHQIVSNMSQENATVLYATSVNTSSTTMSSESPSGLSNSTTENHSSSLLGVVVANGSTPQLQMTEAFEATVKPLESSTSEIQTLDFQTSLASLSVAFTTSNVSHKTTPAVRPTSNYTVSLNKGSTFQSASEPFSTVTANDFTESVYRLANISYTPVSAMSLESSAVPSISGGSRTSDVVEGNTASSDTSPTSLESESTLMTTPIIKTEDIINISPSESVSSNGWQQFSDFISWYTPEPVIVTTPEVFVFPTESILAEQTLSTSVEDVGSDKVSFFLHALSTTSFRSQLVTPLVSETPIISPGSSIKSSVPSIISSVSSLISSDSFSITPQGITSTFPDVFTSSIIPNAANTRVTITPPEDTTTLVVNSTETSTISNRSMKYKMYRVVLTFAGECDAFKENEVLREKFWKALIEIIKQLTKLLSVVIEPENMLCDPLRTYFRITYASSFTDASINEFFESLRIKVSSSSISVPVIDGMHVLNFTARNMKIHEIDTDGPEVAETGLEVVDIVIIGIASFLFAVLVLMMIILVCRECYFRKRTTTFHLTEIPHVNLKLSDFTLTRIPRPKMFYRENSLRKHEPVPLSKLRHSQNGHSRTSSKGKVNVPVDKINVRMRDHDGGLVVGVTCSNPSGPNNDASSSSSSPKSGDQSKRSLLKGEKNYESDGVTNPSYSTDEEVQGTTKIVIQDDENEQLL